MSGTHTATPRREATRQRLFDAATQIFSEVGFGSASVEAVCERAGFTRGAFYSNFDSKEELFVELAAQVCRARVLSVRRRIDELAAAGAFEHSPIQPLLIVGSILDAPHDDRVEVLLMSEIRTHALRDPDLARAYLAQNTELRASVTQIVSDIGSAGGLRFRLPAEQVADLVLSTWESASVNAAMAGLDDAEMNRRVGIEVARIAGLLLEADSV